MTEQVRIGIVGTSGWSDFLHLPSLKSAPQAALVAICGRNRARAAEMAQKYAIPQVFTDYRAMLEKGGLQALVVATPDDLHYPIVMDALDAGLHVLCEKPLALNAEQAKAMWTKAEAVGVKHMVFHTFRWMAHSQHLRHLLDEGYLGRPYHCEFRHFGGYGRGAEYGWRFDSRRSNGILGDLGSHMIDLARWYVGEIASVSAHLPTYVARSGVDGQPLEAANDAALLAVAFANGAQGVIQVSAVAHMAERFLQQTITLHGEAGTLELDFPFAGPGAAAVIRGARHDETHFQPLLIPETLWGDVDHNRPPMAYVADYFASQPVGVHQFINAIIEDRPVSPNFYDGFRTQAVIDAALESHRRGCWVTVSA